jgi:hypothetical protein
MWETFYDLSKTKNQKQMLLVERIPWNLLQSVKRENVKTVLLACVAFLLLCCCSSLLLLIGGTFLSSYLSG